jgi:replication factor A1
LASAPPVPQQKPPQQQQPQRQAGGSRGGRTGSVYPIEGLSPYTNAWTIKARVTQKTDIKTWSNQRGEGKLFSVTFMDESGEIRATGFNAVVDELYDKLQEGKVYFISRARVNLAKKKFSHVANEYELNLEKNTEVEEVCPTLMCLHWTLSLLSLS